ncbi:hypothetical protein BDN72DRAFT_801006 [Pluteus cervinus]|uniref:Uncharacterized protein n=1 Tax=Pluteus cervinus TaxID=181527 RepID=A0ACD3AIT8_9AGAR|nr:hypothetical protein BDN72DRAFT_801006 [Pluteus cervinus]
MEFFSQTYVALRGPTGAVQTPADTINRLSDRLSPATLLADRRAAVLSLKGLAKDCKEDVGERALPGLLQVLVNDAEIDPDIGKAVLETFMILCDVEEGKELGFKHTDAILAAESITHTLFALLADNNFYLRVSILQFLALLLQNRRQVVQKYFLSAPVGPGTIITVLEDKREIIRNEAIPTVQALVSQSADIQKVLAFEGAFEKLFNIVTHEGGVEGGVVAQGALTCVDTLLRFNTSNQSYFRETSLPPALCSLLQFPLNLPLGELAPQEFALQFWDDQKLRNASLIVGIMGMLINNKGGTVQEASTFSRCLIEIALASNAPTPLKTQALRLLPPSLSLPLSEVVVTPYLPVPETNGEEWDRLEQASALDALVELVLHGEYQGVDSGKRLKASLELRASATIVFENFVRTEEIRHAIIQAMLPPDGLSEAPPITPLLHTLASPPSSHGPPDGNAFTSTHFACLLFSHLLRSSPRTKVLARSITPGPLQPAQGGQFFVPADRTNAPPPPAPEPEDDEPPQTLLQTLTENLSLSFLSRSRTESSDQDAREWDCLIVGYLSLLSQWLWEDPKSVKEFLDAGGLGILVEPINQSSEVDSLVPGLCAFLVGVCYEFNREPGEITRSTIHPIINRLGVDTLAGRLARVREDDRFKSVTPEATVLSYPPPTSIQTVGKAAPHDEGKVWFDWSFTDWYKSNHYTIQRGFGTDPNQLPAAAGQNPESAVLIASLREVIQSQAQEIELLQRKLKEKPASGSDHLSGVQAQVTALTEQLKVSEEKRKDVEKEQEDLLVLLDEMTTKRQKDKARLKEAGLEVSEDEGEDDEDEDEDE